MKHPVVKAVAVVAGLGVAGVCLRAAGPAAQLPSTAASDARAARTSSSAAAAAAPHRAVLDKYCVTCHNARLKTAGLALDTMDIASPGGDAERWEKIVRKLRSGSMPPANLPRPEPAASAALVAWLEHGLDRAGDAEPNPGRKPAVHRLNRTEYTNAIRDLFAIDLRTIGAESLLPADDSGYGFDNIADVLSVSPLLLERYLSAASKISSAVVAGDAGVRPATQIYRVNKQTRQDDRMSEDLPFASRGGLAVRHYFPLDGEYLIKIHMLRTYEGKIRGLDDENQLELRVNRALVKRLNIGGGPASGQTPAAGAEARAPRARGQRAGPEATQYLMGADAGLEYRVPAKAGEALIGVSYIRKPSIPEGMQLPVYPVTSYEYAGDTSVLAGIEALEILGPYDAQVPATTPARSRTFVCRPAAASEETDCATRILSKVARQAYRRPITDDDLQPLLRLYHDGRRQGGFEAGIRQALQRILASPDFLFRFEYDPANVAPGSPYRISDLDLASRLSFFLWSSLPDDALLDLAIQGRLREPGVLEQQVRRMLADARAGALIDNFGGQWLHLRNVRLSTPDPYAFPDFDENLRDAMEQETSLFLRSQFTEDRPVLELLTA
jgi:cytochrome c551/c552